MTPKEILLETIKQGGKPERYLKQYEALNMMLGDPLALYIANGSRPGTTVVNAWGVTICWPEGEPGSTPVFDGDRKLIKDITHWRDYVKVPDLQANIGPDEAWEKRRTKSIAKDPDGSKLLTAFMNNGLFEQVHFMMGFEDALTAFYEHPAEMHELIDMILEFKLEYLKILIDKLKPEAIFSHDDWGTGNALFMHEDMWREFFKEPYRKLYGYAKEHGCLVFHHADSYLVPIVEDMAEIGIDVWQGTLPENDIPALQEKLSGRITFMGGIGARIDRADASEEEIRTYMQRILREYCPRGHFIPSITYGLGGTIFKHVDPIINDEIDKYNKNWHFPANKVKQPRRVIREAAGGMSDGVTASDGEGTCACDILRLISSCLLEGDKNHTVKLVTEALDAGFDAESILSDGLIAGMGIVGDAFTDGEIYLPEMLLAAQCMTRATEVLKPHLVSGGGSTKLGKVAIGTVFGDLHDIGKNLCKLMLEGSGFEVIDLGSNVPVSRFVEAVADDGCDIIAMSALLTTTMPAMKDVIDALVDAGLRDKVKVMIGGAPVSQRYADLIGADAYTQDAGSAAREAVRLVTE